MYKKLNEFKKLFNKFKALNPQTDKNKYLQEKVLDDDGDLFIRINTMKKKMV